MHFPWDHKNRDREQKRYDTILQGIFLGMKHGLRLNNIYSSYAGYPDAAYFVRAGSKQTFFLRLERSEKEEDAVFPANPSPSFPCLLRDWRGKGLRREQKLK